MEKTQTYEEAVSKTVMWWAEIMQKPLNQNNGDNSPNGAMGFMLANMVASNAQKSITNEKMKIFENALTERLKEVEGLRHMQNLDVDYHPNRMLAEAAEKAGIDLAVFPCKTWSRIGLNNEVEVSMGYGTVPSVL